MRLFTNSRDLLITVLALGGMVAASFLLIALTASVSALAAQFPVAF